MGGLFIAFVFGYSTGRLSDKAPVYKVELSTSLPSKRPLTPPLSEKDVTHKNEQTNKASTRPSLVTERSDRSLLLSEPYDYSFARLPFFPVSSTFPDFESLQKSRHALDADVFYFSTGNDEKSKENKRANVARDTKTKKNTQQQKKETVSADFSSPKKTALEKKNSRSKAVMIALVIDDMGISKKYSQQVLSLHAPMTLSYLTYAKDLQAQAQEALRRGYEVMLHVSMEAHDTRVDAGPDVLLVRDSEEEIFLKLKELLRLVPHKVGINNHMGSRFTEDVVAMRATMKALREENLLFLDSQTSPHSVGLDIAKELGVIALKRDIFLDHDPSLRAINRQLVRLENHARKKGYAIAIGHPKKQTIQALRAWIKTLPKKNIHLVPLSRIATYSYPLKKEKTATFR